jgi:fluoride exporter
MTATKRSLNQSPLNHHQHHRCFCLSDDAYDLCLQALYISAFGVLGSILRIYLARFFGLDCQNAVSDDWFTRISDAVCVTTNGKTDQTGGALFIDLPANMVGCFVMGLLSPSIVNGINRGAIHPIAWFQQSHELQRHPAFAMALKVGFCGCLTTFASWNTQMVVMLDGTDTVLGSQVVAALVGYLMGMCTALASFVCGQHVYETWVRIHDPSSVLTQPDTAHEVDDAVEGMEQGAASNGDRCVQAKSVAMPDEKPARQSSPFLSQLRKLWGAVSGIRVMPFVLVAGMTGAFVAGDVVYDNMFYRKMWLCVVLSPCGALLRWHLSRYNASPPAVAAAAISRWNLEWVPWGTVASNMIAVVVSVLAEALEDRYAVRGEPGYDWISTVVPAIETGFAGSLSTVSTFVREIADLHTTPTRMYLYGFGSLTFAMLLGLLIYSPLIRFL